MTQTKEYVVGKLMESLTPDYRQSMANQTNKREPSYSELEAKNSAAKAGLYFMF